MASSRPNVTDLAGVWQRNFLVEKGGKDATSTVFWLQFGEASGDIRARAGAAFADTAFAGTLIRNRNLFRWMPGFEHGCLTGGAPDEGTLDLVGDDMFEVGVHAPYLEHWVRVAAVSQGDFALGFVDPASKLPGLLIEIGSFAFCARPDGSGGGAFVLAAREGSSYFVRLSAGCGARPGSKIDWPRRDGDAVVFPVSDLGPQGRARVHRPYKFAKTQEP